MQQKEKEKRGKKKGKDGEIGENKGGNREGNPLDRSTMNECSQLMHFDTEKDWPFEIAKSFGWNSIWVRRRWRRIGALLNDL